MASSLREKSELTDQQNDGKLRSKQAKVSNLMEKRLIQIFHRSSNFYFPLVTLPRRLLVVFLFHSDEELWYW